MIIAYNAHVWGVGSHFMDSTKVVKSAEAYNVSNVDACHKSKSPEFAEGKFLMNWLGGRWNGQVEVKLADHSCAHAFIHPVMISSFLLPEGSSFLEAKNEAKSLSEKLKALGSPAGLIRTSQTAPATRPSSLNLPNFPPSALLTRRHSRVFSFTGSPVHCFLPCAYFLKILFPALQSLKHATVHQLAENKTKSWKVPNPVLC